MAAGKNSIVSPLKVGLLVIVSGLAFAVFLQVISTRQISRAGSYEVHAIFDDVLGLVKKSPVQIAGIDIGRIKAVELVNGRAKVTLEIDGEVELFEDAEIEKVSISLLGDYKLSVEPGTAGKRRLKDGDEIANVKSLSNVDAIMGEIRTMSESMRKMIAGEPGQPAPLQLIVDDVQGSAKAARIVLEEVSKNIGSNTEKLDHILSNIERFTTDLRDISAGKDPEFDAIITDARAIAGSLRRTSESLDRIISGQDEKEISESMRSVKQTLATMNRALENLESITQKIDDGKGTVGKLVNDPTIHEEVAEAAEGVNSLVGGLSRLQTWVNLRSEFQFRTGATKNYVQFILQPKEDKFYILEFVDDPRGVKTVVIDDVETTSPEDGRSFQYRERRTKTETEGLKFSLMFAKRFYWLTLRFGIIEGVGGVGADIHFLDDRLEFLFDVNRFGEEARQPRVKGLALIEVIPHIYVHGGVDDPFNAATVDFFLGLGVRFNDEDLKALITATGGGVPSR